MLSLKLDQELKQELLILTHLEGSESVEDYIISILKREIISKRIIEYMPIIIAKLERLHSGSIFSIIDLIEIGQEDIVSIQMKEEFENLFELYLAKSNLELEYEILFLDEKNFTYTYLKR